jgi:hypothetical protein
VTGRFGYSLGGKWSRAGDYTGPLEDLTGYAAKDTDIVVSWGRAEPRATADAAASRMTFKLLNHARQFSPENTASPIAGRVLTGTPFRLTVGDPNTTPQEGGGTPTGTAKTATLTERFRTTPATATWPGNTSTAAALGWRGRVTMPATVGPSEKWSTENQTDSTFGRYDLVASFLGVEFAELPTSTGAVSLNAVNSFSPENKIIISREGGNLLMRKVESGSVSDTTLTYDPVLHRWVRLAHDGTNVLWQTSDNGLSWTTRRTATTTVDCSSVIVSLEATWQGAVGTGRTAWANLNTAPLTTLNYNPPAYPTGVLRIINDTYTDKADDHYTSGDRIGMYETFWDRAEGAANGTFSSGYATQITNETNLIRSAGLKLTLGLGLTYPPTWALALTNAKFVNESGTVSSVINPVFSQTVRSNFQDYLDWVNSQVGFTNCWSIRITAGTDGELLYPSAGLWGYDLNAKGTGGDLPPTIGASPWPTWTPGTGTVTQAGEWYEWYLDALADCASWQMRYIRSLGYTGWFELLTPGVGTRPSGYATELAARFAGYSATTGVGAVWHKLYQKIAVKAGAVVYCSSMADNSGTPANDVPTGTDSSVGITSSGGNNWSAYRWLARIANEYGMPNGGENPGRGALSDTYYLDTTSTGMTAKLLAQSAGGKALVTYWAHGVEHWTGSPGTRTALGTSWVSQTGTLNNTGPGTPPNPPSV